MKALVLEAYNQFAYQDVPDPDVGPDRIADDCHVTKLGPAAAAASGASVEQKATRSQGASR